MIKKTFLILGAFTVWALVGYNAWDLYRISQQEASQDSRVPAITAAQFHNAIKRPVWPENYNTMAGNFLAAHFAQSRHDWARAADYLARMRDHGADSALVDKRAMVLSLGAGRYQNALDLARKLSETGEDQETGALLPLLVFAAHIKEQDYTAAQQTLDEIPPSSMSKFVWPLLSSWTAAAQGEDATLDLNLRPNTIHHYHAALIADYLGAPDKIEPILQRMLEAEGLAVSDLENIGDLYVRIGDHEQARDIYQSLLEKRPELSRVELKLERLENKEESRSWEAHVTPDQGIAMALYDLAKLLNRERGQESARVFANLALYLDPGLEEAHLLLADIISANERMDEALAHLDEIPSDSLLFMEAQREKASILAEHERYDQAVAILEGLFERYDDIESLIQIGNIHRARDQYGDAVRIYNEAAAQFEDGIPEPYWYLHYVRGMAYEQTDQWDKAEEDLKAALKYEPGNPYVMNYLAYAWTEKGIHLHKALQMLRQAAAQRPQDGYIADSLGWALLRSGKIRQGLPYLEKAVELLPDDAVVNDHLGDAYWKLGRELEARYQWIRAYDRAEDSEMQSAISAKLDHGLQHSLIVREAQSNLPAKGDPSVSAGESLQDAKQQ